MGDTVRDLEQDLEICEAATPGPWVSDGKYVVQDRYDRDDFRQGIFKPLHIPKLSQDLRFAAEARAGWPHAIQRAIDAEKRIDQLQEEIRMLQDSHHRGWPD